MGCKKQAPGKPCCGCRPCNLPRGDAPAGDLVLSIADYAVSTIPPRASYLGATTAQAATILGRLGQGAGGTYWPPTDTVAAYGTAYPAESREVTISYVVGGCEWSSPPELRGVDVYNPSYGADWFRWSLWERWTLLCRTAPTCLSYPLPTSTTGNVVALVGPDLYQGVRQDMVLLRRQFYLYQDGTGAGAEPDWSTIGYVPVTFDHRLNRDHQWPTSPAPTPSTPEDWCSQKLGFFDEWYQYAYFDQFASRWPDPGPWACDPLLLTFYRATDCRDPDVLDPVINYRTQGDGGPQDYFDRVAVAVGLP